MIKVAFAAFAAFAAMLLSSATAQTAPCSCRSRNNGGCPVSMNPSNTGQAFCQRGQSCYDWSDQVASWCNGDDGRPCTYTHAAPVDCSVYNCAADCASAGTGGGECGWMVTYTPPPANGGWGMGGYCMAASTATRADVIAANPCTDPTAPAQTSPCSCTSRNNGGYPVSANASDTGRPFCQRGQECYDWSDQVASWCNNGDDGRPCTYDHAARSSTVNPVVFEERSQVLELTFPGDISTMTASTTDAIKVSIKIEVEGQTGTGTVASVKLEVGPTLVLRSFLHSSIKATVAFDRTVTNAQVRAAAATYTASPMGVTAGGNSMTSTAASSIDAPATNSAASLSLNAACGAAVALAVAMSF